MKKYKAYYIMRLLVSVLCAAGFGVLLFFLTPYATEVFDVLVIALGLLTAVMNLPDLFISLRNIRRPGEPVNLALSLLAALLGVALMLLDTDYLLLLIAVYAVVLPLLRIALIDERLAQLRRELPRFFTGLVIVLIYLAGVEGYVLNAAALLVLVAALIYLLYGLVKMRFIFPKE